MQQALELESKCRILERWQAMLDPREGRKGRCVANEQVRVKLVLERPRLTERIADGLDKRRLHMWCRQQCLPKSLAKTKDRSTWMSSRTKILHRWVTRKHARKNASLDDRLGARLSNLDRDPASNTDPASLFMQTADCSWHHLRWRCRITPLSVDKAPSQACRSPRRQLQAD